MNLQQHITAAIPSPSSRGGTMNCACASTAAVAPRASGGSLFFQTLSSSFPPKTPLLKTQKALCRIGGGQHTSIGAASREGQSSITIHRLCA
jgi:hypothetical protein